MRRKLPLCLLHRPESDRGNTVRFFGGFKSASLFSCMVWFFVCAFHHLIGAPS
ncbi:hypothetical protein BDDG_11772 [Blastomyces dermatitidis ATCC 18188]|uniref:Uncharacterized protein n=1 Tax=Ajellomyces dermatitidis (strain ATCC 18188 / CBS 674.68) TaxID=653446 RepID=A0A0J9EL95_AJEDA|nr:hypothetical protein BDDG_11772 [Blastomyces dermatitidis ATCC 18188]